MRQIVTLWLGNFKSVTDFNDYTNIAYTDDGDSIDPAGRNLYSQRRVGGANRLADDDGGHLIASMFKGSGDIDNLIAMNSQINRKALSEVLPKKVSVSIEPVYSGNSLRPDGFRIRYQIEGGIPQIRSIRNQAGG